MSRASDANASPAVVVLTADGRQRLETRLAATQRQVADLERQLSDDDNKGELLAQRHRLHDQIASLREALAGSVTVDAVVDDPHIVELGDEVELQFEDGERGKVVLVHPLEADAERGHVSVRAPLAQALLGAHIGDEVTVAAPVGSYRARVLDRRRSH